MKPSCALADIASNHVEWNPGGRWQPEGEQMVKSILTWLQGISLRQGLNGIPTQGKGETSEPAQNSCGFFSTREAIGLVRW
jgi:hypothetical protein